MIAFLVALAYVVTSLFVGFGLIGLTTGFIAAETITKFTTVVMDDRGLYGGIGLLILMLCFGYLHSRLRRAARNKSIVFKNPQGKISVTLYAIEEMLKDSLKKRQELGHIRAKVRTTSKGLDVTIRSYLTKEVNVLSFTTMLQENIKDKLNNFLGQDWPSQVKIEIKRVHLDPKKLETVEPFYDENDIPFRNY